MTCVQGTPDLRLGGVWGLALRASKTHLGNSETMESCLGAAKKLWGIQLQIFMRRNGNN